MPNEAYFVFKRSFLEHSSWTTAAKPAIERTAMEVWTATRTTRTFRSTPTGILASEEIQAVNHVAVLAVVVQAAECSRKENEVSFILNDSKSHSMFT